MTAGTVIASTYGVKILGFCALSLPLSFVVPISRSLDVAKFSIVHSGALLARAPERSPAPVTNPIRNKSRRSIFNSSLPGNPHVNKRSQNVIASPHRKNALPARAKSLAGNTSMLFLAGSCLWFSPGESSDAPNRTIQTSPQSPASLSAHTGSTPGWSPQEGCRGCAW